MENPAAQAGTNKNAVIWAIDPFERTIQPPAEIAARLSQWFRDAGWELQPVHVLSLPKELGEKRFDPTEVFRNIKAWENACDQYIRDLGISGARGARMLLCDSSSRKEEVQGLLRYAESTGSPCILVSSHGRAGLSRLVLGSFAETLLLQSKAPVMFVTHFGAGHYQQREPGRRSVFATDFSQPAHRAYRKYLEEAKLFGCEVTLVHAVSFPSIATEAAGAPGVIPNDYYREQVEWARRNGKKWVKEAQALGVRAKLIVRVESVGADIASAILAVAEEEDAGLIAMASVSGAAASFALGSVARTVCRANLFPVLVYGPKSLVGEAKTPRTEQAAYA